MTETERATLEWPGRLVGFGQEVWEQLVQGLVAADDAAFVLDQVLLYGPSFAGRQKEVRKEAKSTRDHLELVARLLATSAVADVIESVTWSYGSATLQAEHGDLLIIPDRYFKEYTTGEKKRGVKSPAVWVLENEQEVRRKIEILGWVKAWRDSVTCGWVGDMLNVTMLNDQPGHHVTVPYSVAWNAGPEHLPEQIMGRIGLFKTPEPFK